MMDSPVELAANLTLQDSTIIEQVQGGNIDLYEVIVRRYNDRLFRIARSIVKDVDEVEDVMQEAYIKAFINLKQFKGTAKFSTWLTRILINEALARVRVKNKSKEVHLDNETVIPDSFLNESAESEEIRKNIGKLLEKAIEELPQKYRLVFVMREIEGLKVSETAELLTITEENVKVRLHRAKSYLRNMLKGSLEGISIYEFHDPRCNRISATVMNTILIRQ